MKIYIITICLLLVLAMCFASCSADANAQELLNRFKNYTPDSSVVAILDSSIFYFADYTLTLRNITGEEELNNGYLFTHGKLYFSTAKENGIFDFSLYVYSCDLHGNDKKLVFEKHGYKTHPWVTGNRETLYIEHYSTNTFDASARLIDSYNVATGTYQTEVSGDTLRLSDFEKESHDAYFCTFQNDILSIIDLTNHATYAVNPVALVYDAFNEELDGFACDFSGFYSADNGKLFLLYRIESPSSRYPYLICEYMPYDNALAFCLLYFADDIASFHVEYLP